MNNSLTLELATPEELVLSKEVSMVIVPGIEGDFGVLKGHAPQIAMLRPGFISVYLEEESQPQEFFVAEGIAEVTGERCIILAEEAIAKENIDSADIKAQIASLSADLAKNPSEKQKLALEKKLQAVELLLQSL